MKTRQFWYPLPERLIAQHPAEKRGSEKMMVLHRATGVVEHRHIADIVEYITANDLLVVNDTKVFPARLIGEWPDTHGAIELLMVNAAPMDADDERPSMTAGTDSLRWNCIIGSGRKCREGQVASFGPAGELKATLLKPLSGIGMWQVEFSCDRPLMDLLDEFGRTPVPPYVKREGTAEEEKEDRERYQTIYAREVGSVAAPTAGLHFTPEIFAALDAKGVRRVAVTLHVGPGTFRPVKADNIEDHHMDFEAFTVPPETAAMSALTGKVASPLGAKVPSVPAPKKFPVDDSMFLYRATAGKGVRKTEIVRGPNIATVPKGVPLAASYTAVCAIKVGDKITTDHIMPAGARLKFRSNIPQYAKFVFEPCDPGFHDNCMANKASGLANVIVAGESYGQGSSREHAALCPMYLGVKAVIAKSIERIHRANLINFGIVPLLFENPKDYDKIDAGDRLELRGIRAAVEGDGVLEVKGPKGTFRVKAELSERERHLVLCGGLLASL